jgi:hypothetical protein
MRVARTLVLLAGLLALTVAGPLAVNAEDPGHYAVEMTYTHTVGTEPPTRITGPKKVVSTFTLSGAYTDSGTASLVSSTENADGSLTEVHSLKGSDGTIQLLVELGAEWYGVWRIGTYTVLSGTRAYSSLQGSGEVKVTEYEGGGWGDPSTVTVAYSLDSDVSNTAPTAVLVGVPGTYPLTVNLSAASSVDEDGAIVRHEWDLDNDGIFEADTGIQSWTTVTVAATGTYTFGVRVTDDDGATDSAYAQVTVYPPTTVQVTAPTDGSTVSGASVRLAATASVPSLVRFVRFLVDGILVGTDSTSPYEISWDSTTGPDGSRTIAAQAVGLNGQVVTDSVTVTVANGPPPPSGVTVSSISPNTTTVGSTLLVTVTGSGFKFGATLAFANGSGTAPVASAVIVTSSGQFTATVSVPQSGPKGWGAWDVVVTNPDGQSGVLTAGFTVVK